MSEQLKPWIIISTLLVIIAGVGYGISSQKNSSNSNTPPAAQAPKDQAPNQPQKKAPSRMLMLHSSNWSFEPNIIRLKKDENVSLHLMGIEGDHNLVIPDLNIKEGMAQGSMKMLKIPTDTVGTFEFYSGIAADAGHNEMKGMIVIEE